jgi:hypothetical protein
VNLLPNTDYQSFFNHFMQGKPHSAIADGFSFADEMLIAEKNSPSFLASTATAKAIGWDKCCWALLALAR